MRSKSLEQRPSVRDGTKWENSVWSVIRATVFRPSVMGIWEFEYRQHNGVFQARLKGKCLFLCAVLRLNDGMRGAFNIESSLPYSALC